jgi:hypothetical protein
MSIDHDSKRRVVLRSALAAGGALCFPGLWGCGKKPETANTETGSPTSSAPSSGEGAPGPATSGQSAPGAGSPQAANQPSGSGGKTSQAAAKYQGQPKGNQKCGNCMHFIAESNTCKVVEGSVSPEGWCTLFAAKQG